jgi:hypothetical protein
MTLPHVPFTVPIPGMTFDEYLQYLSWRIEFQILAVMLADKTTPKSKIIDQLVEINQRATRFPVQPLPDDLPTIALELTEPNLKPGFLSVSMLIRELTQIFS